MTQSLFSLFGLRAGEGPLFFWFFLYKALWGAAVALGGAAGESLFIKGWGVQALPFFFIAGDVAVMAAAAGHTRLSRRLAPGPVFRLILGLFAGLAALLTLLFASGAASGPAGAWMAFLAYLGFYVLVELGWLHFFNFQRRYLDIQQGKRLLPRILGGYSAGFVVGGLGVVLLLRISSVTGLLAAWTVALAGALVALEFLGRRVRPVSGHCGPAASPGRPPPLRELLTHPLAVWILGFTALSVFTMRLFEFQANDQFSRLYPTGEELAVFYGTYSAGARIVGLLVQLALVPWAIRLLGLARAGLVYPLFACVSGTALALGPGLWPAMGARFCHSCLVYTVADPQLTLLASGLPAAAADRVNVLAVGWVMRLSTVVVSLGMLALAQAGLASATGAVSLLLAWALLAMVLPLGRLYSRAVLDTLRGGQGDARHLERMDLSVLPDSFFEELERHVRGPEPAVAAMAVDLLARSRRAPALDFLARLLAEPGPPELKARIYASLPAEDSANLRHLLELGLASDNASVKAAALRARGKLEGARARGLFEPFHGHPEPRLRAAAAAWLVADSGNDTLAAARFPGFVGDPDPGVVLSVLQAHAERRPAYGYAAVARCTAHPEAAVREAALVAATGAGRFQSASVMQLAGAMTVDRAASVRLAAVRALAPFPGATAAGLCAKALADPSRQVARAAGESLLQMGAPGAAAVWTCAASNSLEATARHHALALLASMRQYQVLRELGEDYVARGLCLAVLRGELPAVDFESPAEALMAGLLDERLRDSALLGADAITRLKDADLFGILERRLTSADSRLLAHALEALLNLGERELTPGVQLLLERREPAGRAAAAKALLGSRAPAALRDAALELRGDGDPFLLTGWAGLAAARRWSLPLRELASLHEHSHPFIRDAADRARRAA